MGRHAEFDWGKIFKEYDEGKTVDEIIEEYGMKRSNLNYKLRTRKLKETINTDSWLMNHVKKLTASKVQQRRLMY